MRSKVLFVINGLGLGNSTRCHAIIERLADSNAEIEIVTSGNGEWYFQELSEVSKIHVLKPLQYGKKNGKISMLRTLGSLGNIIRIIQENKRELSAIIKTFSPDVVVGDSEYGVGAAKKLGIPLVSLNNSDVVYFAMKKFRKWPKSILPQFLFVGCMDFLFHQLVPDVVISPTLDPEIPSSGGKFKRVGPIVRRKFVRPEIQSHDIRRVLIMLSGSVFGSPVQLEREDYPYLIDIVGRPQPENWEGSDRVTYHGKIKNTENLILDSEVVVVNGGFSAVSEMFFTRTPMVVVPVPRHAEQWINARVIEALGVGVMSSETDMEEAMRLAAERVEEFRAAYARLPRIEDGARQAADIILDLANK